MGVCVHTPLTHASTVQRSGSWQSREECWQALLTHASNVQTSPSSQLGGAPPPTQTPAEQVSMVVQMFPSLQGPLTLTCTQPLAGLHESFVHTLLSSQLGGGPPTQTPAEHLSPVVQALTSKQRIVLFVWTQPVAGLQVSFVQPL